MRSISTFTLCIFLLALSGCYSKGVIFYTKTTVGVDADMITGTAEVSINRHEGVIEPVFENGETPSVVASFKADGTVWQRFFGVGITQTFSTGVAAETIGILGDIEDEKLNPQAVKALIDEQKAKVKEKSESIDLTKRPKPEGFFSWFKWLGDDSNSRFVEPGDSYPLLFTTDTLFGIKLRYQGPAAAAALPSGIQIGFNRTEFAWAPLGAQCAAPFTENCKENAPNVQWKIYTPSVLGILDTSYQLEQDKGSKEGTGANKDGYKYLQYFATGKAAIGLAKFKVVRDKFLPPGSPPTTPTVPHQ